MVNASPSATSVQRAMEAWSYATRPKRVMGQSIGCVAGRQMRA